MEKSESETDEQSKPGVWGSALSLNLGYGWPNSGPYALSLRRA